MRTIFKLFILLGILSVSFSACTKEGLRGPAGEAGDPGPQGPKGENGSEGTGNANVLKYTFSVQEADWALKSLGGTNNVLAYEIKASDINNVDLGNAEYVVVAYAKPDNINYPRKKMLPFTYNHNTQNNATIKIDLLMGDGSEKSMLIATKTSVSGNPPVFTNTAAEPTDMLTKITFEIFLIKLTALSKLGNISNDMDYDQINTIYLQNQQSH